MSKVEIIADGGPFGSNVAVDGQGVGGISEVVFRHRAGSLPEVVLHREAMDVTVVGEVTTRIYVGGTELTGKMLDGLRAVDAKLDPVARGRIAPLLEALSQIIPQQTPDAP